MSSTESPFGLRPVRHLYSGTPQRRNLGGNYTINATTSDAIFHGDLVKRAAQGNEIVVGAATDTAFLGVFDGVEYDAADGSRVFSRSWPSGGISTATNIVAYVYDDPNTVFEVQAEDVVAAADLGATTDITTNVAGSTRTGTSGMAAVSNALSGANLKILDYSRRGGEALGDAYPILEVIINEHELRGTVTAV